MQEIRGGYKAGDPVPWNTNLWRDAKTLLLYPVRLPRRGRCFVVGTLQLRPDGGAQVGGKVQVTWVAENYLTLGSPFRVGDLEWWNGLVEETGPFSQAEQEIYVDRGNENGLSLAACCQIRRVGNRLGNGDPDSLALAVP